MTILFITRKYPPQIGGMETFCFELFRHLNINKRLVAQAQGSRFSIIWIVPLLFIHGLIKSPGSDLIYIADGVLAPVGWLLKVITRKPVVMTIHGLELTYNFLSFKKLSAFFYQRLDRIITVSENTRQLALKQGIREDRLAVIPNGVAIPSSVKKFQRQDLNSWLKRITDDLFIIVSIGRLVKRKGITWFIEEVCPKLENNFLYLIGGAGPEEPEIASAINKTGLNDRIIMLGRISESEKEMLLQTGSCFVMPNIPVSGDVEGFGISAIEAAVRGLPVIAANLEGLRDAVIDGHNGYLFESGNVSAFLEKINNLRLEKDPQFLSRRIAEYTKKNYNWKFISHLYLEKFKQLLNKSLPCPEKKSS